MEELINSQHIKFDNHKAGDGSAASLAGLHMHKRMNKDRYNGVQVRFYVDGTDRIEFVPEHTTNDTQLRLINEIKNTLKKDPQKRDKLVKSVIHELNRYSSGLPSTDRITAMRAGARRIASIFSHNNKIQNQFLDKFETAIRDFITVHLKEDGTKFFIKQDFMNHTIEVTDDRSQFDD